jgi:tetratricopeptide (TPR) repeat protein
LRKAIELAPMSATAHNNLGIALKSKGQLDEAIACYKKAIALDPKLALPHCNLAVVLINMGQFRQGVVELRCGYELGSRNPRWDFAKQCESDLREAERLARLDNRLADVLHGKDLPRDAEERIAFARICQLHRRQYAAAGRFYAEAFVAEPKLATDRRWPNRYKAACAAALAGCGQGKDAAGLGEKERAGFRRQALDWLRADLEALRHRLAKEPAKAKSAVVKTLRDWQKDTDFAGVRGKAALAKLPEAERAAWGKLWADVADMLARAQEKTAPEKSPPK